jgi:SseB protein N-terminal domain
VVTGQTVPWHRVDGVSGHLNPGGQQFRHDHGDADPQVTGALAAYHAGKGSEQAALTALAGARLLVPVVALLADGSAAAGEKAAGDKAAGDKNSEMVLPTLIGNDGRPAVLAFTGVEALARWRRNARPVPAEAARVWRAAVTDGCAVVIDVAGPVPLAVEGARLAALAAGQQAPSAHQDPDVRAEVEAAVAAEPLITGFGLAAATEEEGAGAADLAVRLHLAPADRQPADWQAAVNRAASRIAGRLAGRLRRGIEFSVARHPIGS